MTDPINPAFTEQESNANNIHTLMWTPIYTSGAVGSSNSALIAELTYRGISGVPENEALQAMTVALDADADADIDPVATTATAGTPGSFGGAGTAVPWNLAALNIVKPRPIPATDWTTGQRVVLGDGSTAHWLGTALPTVTATATTNVVDSVAHGLTAGSMVIFTALTGGAGLTVDTRYFVIASGLTANAFKVSATAGGAEIDITTDVTVATAYKGAYAVGSHA